MSWLNDIEQKDIIKNIIDNAVICHLNAITDSTF